MMTLLAAAMAGQAADINQNFGLQFGFDRHLYRLNSPSVSGKDKNELSVDPLNGGKIGFVYDVTFYEGLGLFLDFNYSYTMHNSPWRDIAYNELGLPTKLTGIQYRSKAEEHMLDWNVLMQYKFDIAGNTYLSLFTGPSIQYIAQYKSRDYFRTSDGTEIYPGAKILGWDVNTEDIAPYYKNYNVSWGVGLMFQYDCYFIRGGYNFGLINPYKEDCWGNIKYVDENGQTNDWFKRPGSNEPDDRLTRGRMDSWYITLGVFLWQSEK